MWRTLRMRRFVIITTILLLLLVLEQFLFHKRAESTIQNILNEQRNSLQWELRDYEFPGKLEMRKFTLSTGGKPLRSIVLGTSGSGAQFMQYVMERMPGNIYYMEPFLDYAISETQDLYENVTADNLRRLLNCNYKHFQRHLPFWHSELQMNNLRLQSLCVAYPEYCSNPAFLSEYCKMFPSHVMKLQSPRLILLEELLKDYQSLDARVLLLVRDPRGVWGARKKYSWCRHCHRADLLCADMVADYGTAMRFQHLYPDHFKVVRYEDLMVDSYSTVENVFRFFGLPYHIRVETFLEWHINMNNGGGFGKIEPFAWATSLNFSEIQNVQENCGLAMKLWGYVKAHNESHLRSISPVTVYEVPGLGRSS